MGVVVATQNIPQQWVFQLDLSSFLSVVSQPSKMPPNQPLPYTPPQRGRWAVTYDAAGVMNCAFVLTLCLYHDMGVLPQYIAALQAYQKEVNPFI